MSSVIFWPSSLSFTSRSFSPSSLPFTTGRSQSRFYKNIVTLPKFKESKKVFVSSDDKDKDKDSPTLRYLAESLDMEYHILKMTNDIEDYGVVQIKELVPNSRPPKHITTLKISELSMTVPPREEKQFKDKANTFILETEEALVALVLMPGITAEEDIKHVLMNDVIALGTKEGVKPVYIARIELNHPDRFDFNHCAKTFLEEGVLKVTIQKKLS